MPYNSNIHHRRSIRLKNYDYSSAGMYFITLCSKNMKFLFGSVSYGKMVLNEAGVAAMSCWHEIPVHFPFVALDTFVIMPNHIHGIIQIRESCIVEVDKSVANVEYYPLTQEISNNVTPRSGENILTCSKQPRGTSNTIGSIVRGYKIGVTKWFRLNTDIYHVWNRDYYEHIIRNEIELSRIRNYIKNNPAKWKGNFQSVQVKSN